MSTQPKASVRPIHVILPEGHGDARILRGVGFRACCECSWRGSSRRSYMEARKDLRAHKLYHATMPRASIAGPL